MVKIYLDQSVYGHLIDVSPQDWRKGEIATLLLDSWRSKTAEVWATSTNIIETAQTGDSRRKQLLAQIILDLIDGRRIATGPDFVNLWDFLELMEAVAPGFLRRPEFVRHHEEISKERWLCALALLAAKPDLPAYGFLESMKKAKAISRLLHARFAQNPGEWVEKMIAMVAAGSFTKRDPLVEFENRTSHDLDEETAQLEVTSCRLTKKDLARLNKVRMDLAQRYGGIEIGPIISSVFTLPMELELTFDIVPLVRKWSFLRKRTGCEPLPDLIAKADPMELVTNSEYIHDVLQRAILAATNIGLVSTTLRFQTILLEMQKCINDRELPTGGLTFDADHAVSLMWCDIFVTRDEKLAAALKTLAEFVLERSRAQRVIHIVGNAKQLAKALQKIVTTCRKNVS